MEANGNIPLENPKLKELFKCKRLARSEAEYGEAMNLMAREIVMNARFLSVIRLSEEPEGQGDGTAVFRKDAAMGFPMLSTQEEKRFYPAFIDWEELGKWEAMRDAAPRTLIMGFDDYAAMVLDQSSGDGVVINPFGDSLVLDRETLAQWRGTKQLVQTGHTECKVEQDTAVRLGDPKEYPSELAGAVSAFAQRNKGILRLWLRLMEKGGELSYLIVVDFQGDRSDIFGGLAGAARPYLNGLYLDMVPYADNFGQQAVDGVEPFFQQKSGWLN